MIVPLPNRQFDSLDCLKQALHRTEVQRKGEDGEWLRRTVCDTNGNASFDIFLEQNHAANAQVLFGGYTEKWKGTPKQRMTWVNDRDRFSVE
jgi:hypothetical protein